MSKDKLLLEPAYLNMKMSLAASCVLIPVILATGISQASADPQDVSDKDERSLSSYNATRLILENVQQDIVLNAEKQTTIVIDKTPDTILNVTQQKNTVIVRGLEQSSNPVISSGLNVTVIAINGAAHFSTSATDGSTTRKEIEPLKITVPLDSEIAIRGHRGSIMANGPHGTITYQGRGKLTVDYVEDIDLYLSGNARIKATEIRGDVFINGSGNSKISIVDGRIENAVIALKGNSKFKFPGSADNLHLTAKGNTRFTVGGVSSVEQLLLSGNARAKFLDESKTFSALPHYNK